jgi:SNF2 family DNA or RNA helicase
VTYTVGLDQRSRLVVATPYHPQVSGILARLPDRRIWDASAKVWRVNPSRVNIEYLQKQLPQLKWFADAQALATQVLERGTPPTRQDVSDYVFADPPPFNHQREGFARSRYAQAYAFLMEQGTGKTRDIIDTACDHFLRSEIDFSVVICPNGVKSTWEEEIARWTPPGVRAHVTVYDSKKKAKAVKRLHEGRQPGVLQWLIINVEALSSKGGIEWLHTQLDGRRAMGTVDEASRIKSPTAVRSKAVVKLRPKFLLRRIATGTLITQGPLDAYMPFHFLNPAILGFTSFYSFRNAFAILDGRYNQVVEYINLDKLQAMIAPFSYRVLRKDCLDLPPKIYQRREVQLNEQQRRLYNQMADQMVAELQGEKVAATIVLTQMLRLTQITGGFMPREDITDELERPTKQPAIAIPGPNPKLEALEELIDETTGKIIIWCRFRPEIELVQAALRNEFGDETVVEFHGGVDPDTRTRNRQAFQDPSSPVRFFVGQQDAGGIGITLTEASCVVYFSNSFSLEARLQSEDRAHRAGQTKSVLYVDLIAQDTLDEHVVNALRGKKELARLVTGDTFQEWI